MCGKMGSVMKKTGRDRDVVAQTGEPIRTNENKYKYLAPCVPRNEIGGLGKNRNESKSLTSPSRGEGE